MLCRSVPSYSKSIKKKEPVDLRASVVKLLGAQCMVELYDYFKGKPDIIRNGFMAVRLLK